MDEKAFSSIDFVSQCLQDEEKFKGFNSVLKRVVKPGDAVLDVGTGSGILALIAASRKPKSICALEFDPYIARSAQQNLDANGYSDIAQVVTGDARTYRFNKGSKFNVVIMEMLTVGMIDEFQIQAINNLHKQGVVSKGTTFVPARQETFITVAEVDFNLYKFTMKMVLHLWNYYHKIGRKELSTKMLLSDIDFKKETNERFSKTIRIPIRVNGTINAIILSSRAVVGTNIYLEDTKSLNPPVAIPLPDYQVKRGQIVSLKIEYIFGHGFQNFKATLL